MKTTKQTLTSYKQKLLAARELRAKTGGLIYDRIKLLCEVFDDRDFRADLGNIDDGKAADILDAEVADLPFPFLTLRSLVEFAPDRATWEGEILGSIYDRYHAEFRKINAEAAPPVTRRRATIEQLDDAIARAERAEAIIANLNGVRDENARLRVELAEARETIGRLERENADLRARMYGTKAVA